MVFWQKGCFCWCILHMGGSIPARSVGGFFGTNGGFFWYIWGFFGTFWAVFWYLVGGFLVQNRVFLYKSGGGLVGTTYRMPKKRFPVWAKFGPNLLNTLGLPTSVRGVLCCMYCALLVLEGPHTPNSTWLAETSPLHGVCTHGSVFVC